MRTLVAAIVGPKQAKAEAKPPQKTRSRMARPRPRASVSFSPCPKSQRPSPWRRPLADGRRNPRPCWPDRQRAHRDLRQFPRCVPLKAANSASTAPPSTCEAQPRPSKKASRSCRKTGSEGLVSTIPSSATSACLGCRTSPGRAGCGVAPKPKRPRRRSIGCQSRRLALPPASAIWS